MKEIVARFRTEKVRNFEGRRGPKRREKRRRKKHILFVSWKAFYFPCYFLITSFPVHFKEDFLELEVVFP
jgi:hypothetical protein